MGPVFRDPRLRAALVLSPGAPRAGSARRAFSAVSIPWMLMTGTEDEAPIGGQTPASPREVFPALPPGSKYELVLFGAQHGVFTDAPLAWERPRPNPRHHRAILALSTAFWDAYLRGDGRARAWLEGAGPPTVLHPADLWQKK
ncbi:MAG: hypothetical protein ACP5VN_09795 [Acidobacteriota bacterium]